LSKRLRTGIVAGVSVFHPSGARSAAVLAICLAAALALLAPSVASAGVTLYATADGGGTECTQADPCPVRDAIASAADGDTVVLLYSAGHDYEICASCTGLWIDRAITLRGEPGQPRPTIQAPASGHWPAAIQVVAPGVAIESLRVEASGRQALVVSTTGTSSDVPPSGPVDGSVIRDVELDATGSGSVPGVEVNGASTLERATVRRHDSEARDALWLRNGALVRDSFVIRESGASGVAIRTRGSEGGEIRLRNLTVFGTADGIFAVEGPYDISVRNSLIDGQIDDIAATGPGLNVEVTHSNLNPEQISDHRPEAVVDLVAPNQDQRTDVPVLADPLLFDFHEMATSATVDAGSPDPFTGSLDVDGEPRLMGDAIDIGADELRDDAPDTSIDPGPAPPTGPATGPLRSSPPSGAGRRDGTVTIAVRGKRLKLHGRRAVIRLTCPGNEVSGPCGGTVTLKAAAKLGAGGRRRKLTLGRARFSIAAGKTERVVPRFTKRAIGLLSKHRAARRAKAVVQVHDAAGNRNRVTKALRLLLANPHRRGTALFLAAPRHTTAAFPGRPGKIVFVRRQAIQTVDPDGHHRHRLRYGADPAYSPDGRLIAYVVGDGEQSDLMVMRSDGSRPRIVLDSEASEEQPAFSADGKRIFFVRDARASGYGDIYSVELDGSNQRRLTDTGGGETRPAAAANGRYIVFERSGRLFTMRPNGSRPRRLTRGSAPTISPNSHRIAFSRYGQLYSIGAGGGSLRELTHFENRPGDFTRPRSPAFSPDGRRLVFALHHTFDAGPGFHDSQYLATIPARGGEPRRLMPGFGDDDPDWQPRR
jgi:hypothetical protein